MKRTVLLLLMLLVAVPLLVSGGGTYTVRPGDNLSRIAAKHGTTVEELVRLNADRYPSLKSRPDLIEPGWVLVLPGADGKGPGVIEQAIAWVKSRAIPAIQKWGRGIAQPTSTPRASGTPQSPNPSGSGLQIGDPAAEEEILRMFNEERQSKGLPALVMDEGLRNRSCERTRDMFQRGYFSHYDPVTGENLSAGAGGEILARSGSLERTPVALARGWWNSPGHYEIIVYPDWHRVGICPGYSGGIWILTAQFLP